ncbi:hypothetical protein KKF05_01825 [Patescibacteria group bacterium]|nr:hypothetical protein [Patescibacteria group bacterium]MBU1916203.1 hypothetical protein [Patescibacteria group bacterium]
MGKPISTGQSHSVVQALSNNIDWSRVDSEAAQWVIEHAGEAEITAFINNRARIIVGEPTIIQINRAKPFDPATFIGEGWSFWRGPADGDGLTGEIEQDARSLALTEVDITKTSLKTCLSEGKKWIEGEEFLRRLRATENILLDAGVFQTFWENPYLHPQKWKEKTNGNLTRVFFTGSVLRDPNGSRCILYLYWLGGRLYWSYGWLGNEWRSDNPVAVLA